MKPVSLQRTTCKNHPPTCFFFATAIFSPPIKVLGGFIKCLPLLYWRSIQICNSGFHLVFFFLGCPVCYYTESKWWWCRTHLLLFLLHQRFTYWHKKNISVLYGSLPSLGFSQSAMQCVFFCVFFLHMCKKKKKTEHVQSPKFTRGSERVDHFPTLQHLAITHTRSPPPFFTFDNLHSKVIL